MTETGFTNLLTAFCQIPTNDAERAEHYEVTQAVVKAALPYFDKYPIAPHADIKNDYELVRFLLIQLVNVLSTAMLTSAPRSFVTARQLAELRRRHQESLGGAKSVEVIAWLAYIDFCSDILKDQALFTVEMLEMMCEREIEDLAAMACHMVQPFSHPLLDLIDQ